MLHIKIVANIKTYKIGLVVKVEKLESEMINSSRI